MQALTVFNFQERDVRIQMIDDKPWWVAKDVCELLELGNITEALRAIPEKNLTSEKLNSGKQSRGMKLINEPGLYRLIGRSNKPEALVFQDWIYEEVLPSIRKTGSYSVSKRDPIAEIERLAIAIQPVIGGINNRLIQVEERQKQIDPQEIERRMVFLNECKNLLVVGTKGKPQPVTHPKFWQELKKLIGINSFQNRAALTLDMMDKCVAYAKEWCETRGVNPPSLFDAA